MEDRLDMEGSEQGDMMDLLQEARNAKFEDVVGLLERQHETKYDAVVPSTHLRYRNGLLRVRDGATVLRDAGVSMTTASFRPTDQFESHLSERLGIPIQYLRKMREDEPEKPDLLDINVNHWMMSSERNWFVRGFRDTDPESEGIARAFLSDRYNVIDHLDAVFAVLDGIRDGGVGNIKIKSADLSERKLRVKIEAPEITAAAPRFLERYRSNGSEGSRNPLISAGLVVTNSETGGAAFQIAPQITVLVCQNGMTRTADALRKVHLGEKMDAGAIQWSEDTKRKNIELITAQTTDAVRSFLSHDYIERVADELDEKGQKLLDRPMEVIESVGKKLRYSEAERERILTMFVKGGDTRASGVVQAFTAYARDVDSPDRAAEIEEQSFEILALAAQS